MKILNFVQLPTGAEGEHGDLLVTGVQEDVSFVQ